MIIIIIVSVFAGLLKNNRYVVCRGDNNVKEKICDPPMLDDNF